VTAHTKVKSLLGADELNMLLTPLVQTDAGRTLHQGFQYRNIFLLLCALWFLFRLLFFPDAVYQVLSLPAGIESFASYLQKRGWVYVFWLVLYSWSYVKNWYFERVALLCFASELTSFWMDYLTVYDYIPGPLSPALTFFILMRFAFIGCLLLNVLYAHRAPPLPRTFWR